MIMFCINNIIKVDKDAVHLLGDLRDTKVPDILDASLIWSSTAEEYLRKMFLGYFKFDFLNS